MKCVILITQVALQASHRKQADVRTEKVIQEFFFSFISWMTNITREFCQVTIFCKHFTFRSFSREMKRDLIPSHSSDKLLCNLHLTWKLIIVFLPDLLYFLNAIYEACTAKT